MKSLDAFGKPIQEFQVKTACGGYLSVCSFLVIFLLFITELRYFLQLETKDDMVIDQNQDQKYLNISFDITFFQVPCSVLHMNLIDPKKANVMHAVHEIYKQRISKSGAELGKKVRDSLANVAQNSAELEEAGHHNSSVRAPHVTPHLRCGSCFSSHVDEDDCCNSCDDVKQAYKNRGWSYPTDFIFEQCEEESYNAEPPQKGEGCHVTAQLHVRKVASTIHLGVGRYFNFDRLKSDNHKEFVRHLNFSHRIHHLSFGPDFPGLVHVLDGRLKNHHVPPNSEHFQYDIHVIPTRYMDEYSEEIVSHQYSVTEYVKSIDQRARHQELVAVGLWANYDFTPFEVKVTRSRKSFMHFLTECCAILGGIFAFTGMLDNFSYRINKTMARRSKAGARSANQGLIQ
jgi:hypothetical protein|mmetsp:Transcript_72870/g.115349  ORF Transcript_72870/g.115349 Transcript_72870/m.115349 type:complete len:400 (+) Transcript_72870:81-1280(+)|eukprot:CAMPEP_0169124378 /NCGR_PEP_ID=MMETSP1015-20121227/34293_1 /TAXON_ID=342587 /ORGANISM="Karlodinium micrum, Strain CCMP2283" /LENGTH=399 /DNA_ID=CAMNT_0009187791 /DNA_START=81 /DNA_END=1280 /DNA_ORIENTATION=-